jgi:hypothetical protein
LACVFMPTTYLHLLTFYNKNRKNMQATLNL